jgi:hypothetical protein
VKFSKRYTNPNDGKLSGYADDTYASVETRDDSGILLTYINTRGEIIDNRSFWAKLKAGIFHAFKDTTKP